MPFAVFWLLALGSNICAGAQAVAVLWAIGDDRLPAAVLVAYQTALLAGTLLGVAAGSRLAVRLGHRRCIAVGSVLEALCCLIVAAVAISPDGALRTGQAVAVAVVLSVLPFAAGMAGPSWVALVSRWPGTADPTRQLLLDSTQFQAGRLVGPLIGAAVLAATVLAVPLLSVANAVTFVGVAAVVLLLPRGADDVAERAPQGSWRETRRWRDPIVWGLAAIGACADGARVYLPRFIRQQGEEPLVYSLTVSMLALAAVLAAAVASRLRVEERALGGFGLAGTAAGLLAWVATPVLGPAGWLLGGALLGGGAALATAGLTSALMTAAGTARRASAAATAMVVRNGVGAAGGAVLALLVALGPVAYVPFAAAAALAARTSRRPPPA